MIFSNCDYETAIKRLEKTEGRVKQAIKNDL